MALLKFKQGLATNLPSYVASGESSTVGVVYITSDTQEMKVDLPSGRINISDFVIADSVDDNGILTVGGKAINKYFDNLFYYVKGETVLRKCTATEIAGEVTSVSWIKIGDLTALNSAVEALTDRVDNAEGKISALEAKDTELESVIAGLGAEDIKTESDIYVTTKVGNLGIGNIPANTSIQALLLSMLCADSAPSVTNTSLKFSKGETKYIEVGSSTTQEVTASFEDGKYPYGYALTTDGEVDTTDGSDEDKAAGVNNSSDAINHPGVTKSAFTINYRGGDPEASSTASDTLTVTLNSGVEKAHATQSASASVTHSAGYIPVSILKNKYKSKKISSNTRTATLEAFRWYEPMYYGFKYEGALIADPEAITATEIKALSGTVTGETAYNRTTPTNAKATGSWRQYFIAIPVGCGVELEKAVDTTNQPLPVKKVANNVKLTFGAAEDPAEVMYEVFYIAFPSAFDTVEFNLTWKQG